MSTLTSGAFYDRILPAPVEGGFSMEDYWVWCGSVVHGEDGLWHMFASRWPRVLPFFEGYLTHSEVVRATSPTPGGPYTFQEVVLPARGPGFWDGRITHNPTIHRCGDKYLLFYIGSTYREHRPIPQAGESLSQLYKSPQECYGNIRIGMAVSSSLTGPWERPDRPILEPRAGEWDDHLVTNPAPCVRDDGGILLIYRSNTPNGLRLGAAFAPDWRSPFERLSPEPIPLFFGDTHVEDPFVWWCGDHYEMLAKDLTGALTGEVHAGVHVHSPDALHWTLSDPAKAYSRMIRWSDGTVTHQGCLERPQLLFDKSGKPIWLFAATGDGPGGFNACTRTWNIAIPLASAT